jgi:enoyl-CoA hydratase
LVQGNQFQAKYGVQPPMGSRWYWAAPEYSDFDLRPAERSVDSPVRLDQERRVRPGPAPDLGEHTESVLRDLGFDTACSGLWNSLRNAPLAVAVVKRVVTERTAFRDEDAFVEQDQIVAPVLVSRDAKEGTRALTEKRSPHWRGR